MYSAPKYNMKLLKGDLLLLMIFLAVAGVMLFLFRYGNKKEGDYALITLDGMEYARMSLDEDAVLDIVGANGTNRVVVKDGKAYMECADCPDQICVNHVHIMYNAETIVCLPHKLIVTICSEKESEIDAVTL